MNKLRLMMVVALASTVWVSAQPQSYNEAPALAEQVEAGNLPPVAERVPEDAVVLTPVERVGTYGGTWRMALNGAGDGALLERTIGYENLLRYDREWKEIIPNLATSYEASEDGRTYTLELPAGCQVVGRGSLYRRRRRVLLRSRLIKRCAHRFPGRQSACHYQK